MKSPVAKNLSRSSCNRSDRPWPREKKLLYILLATILAWATEPLHNIDANSVSVLSVLVLLFPVIGVADWKAVAKKVDLGTIALFGACISMGELLFKTGAATWAANRSLGAMGVTAMRPMMIMIVFAVAIFFVRLAFASSAAAVSALIPTILGFLLSAKTLQSAHRRHDRRGLIHHPVHLRLTGELTANHDSLRDRHLRSERVHTNRAAIYHRRLVRLVVVLPDLLALDRIGLGQFAHMAFEGARHLAAPLQSATKHAASAAEVKFNR